MHLDPGHGWLEVQYSELVKMGIADKITSYSFRAGNTCYLEEDCDLTTFVQALPADTNIREWFNHEVVTKTHKDDAPCRDYPRYHA
jgi:hypothetical protein